jgi:hypothetical protein
MNKARALLAAAAAISLGLATAPAAQAAGAPEPPGGVALTWAPTYMSSDHDYTSSEAVSLAKTHDLIVGMPIAFENDVAVMRQANPDLTLLSYANAMFLDGSGAGVPESEFAHDTAGRRIRSTAFGNYLMEPSSPGWRNRSIADCRNRANGAGYDGCLLDMLTMGIFSNNYVTSLPRRPGGGQYTEAQWRDQLISVVREFRAEDPAHIHVGNAVSNSHRYWREEVSSRPIALSLPAAQMEDFLRGSHDATTNFPSTAEWLDSVNVVKDLESQGVTGLYSTKLWSSASSAQVAQWQRYSMSSFLMGANGDSYFAFTRSRDQAGATGSNAPYRMPKEIGNPTSAMYGAGSGYVRDFTNGKAVTNPTGGTVTINLGGSYRGLDGRTVSSVTLPPYSGDVLIKSGTSTTSTGSTSGSTEGGTSAPTSPTTTTSGTNTSAPQATLTSPSARTVRSGSIRFAGTAKDADGIASARLAVLNRNTGRWLQANGTWGGYATRTAAVSGTTSGTWELALPLSTGSYWVGVVVTDKRGNTNPSPRPGITLTVE